MTYKETLEKIAKPNYGLQAIQEDYPIENIEYFKELSDYYASIVNRYQILARNALKKGQQNEE